MKAERLEAAFLGFALVAVALELWPVGVYLASENACELPTQVLATLGLRIPHVYLPLILLVVVGIGGLLLAARMAVRVVPLLVAASLFFLLCLDQRLFSNHMHLLVWLSAFYGLRQVARGADRAIYRLATIGQLSVVYLCTAAGKFNPYFLSGGIISGYWTDVGLLALPTALRTEQFLSLVSSVAVLIEVGLGVGLWIRRYRAAVLLGGALFHLSLALTARPELTLGVTAFSLAMMSGYAATLGRASRDQ